MYRIPEHWGIRREPRISEEQRKSIVTWGKTFDEQYDWDILFSDCVDIGDDRILLIGAPLYELKEQIQFTDGENVLPHQVYDMDRVSITLVSGSCETLYIRDLAIPVTPASTKFEGMGCVVTMQKDEPMPWIRDWITYYYKEHGVRGFCIYSNNSEDYTVSELQEYLDAIELPVVVEVVDWCMPYGPETPTWDSDFSRYVMYENFKYRYGWCCDYVLNQDVDELLLIKGGIKSVLQQMKSQQLGAIIYGNRNIDSYNSVRDCYAIDLPVEQRTFSEYYYYSKELNNPAMRGKRSIPKWLALPEYSMDSQWKNHEISGDVRQVYIDKNEEQIYFAHFYSMQSKNQNHNPRHSTRNTALVAKENLMIDRYLQSKLEEIFKL